MGINNQQPDMYSTERWHHFPSPLCGPVSMARYCNDGSEIRRSPVDIVNTRICKYPMSDRVFLHRPRWLEMGFLKHQRYFFTSLGCQVTGT